MKKKVYEIQGNKFRLKPTTPRNIKNLVGEGYDELDDAQDYSVYISVLRRVTDPVSGNAEDYNNIDVEDLDVKLVEEIVADFLPRLMPILGAPTN